MFYLSIVLCALAAGCCLCFSSIGFAADDQAPHGKPNHLIRETSPYLLQHAYNPVDWYPWGDEAFAKAKKEDKPIFLSVGYSTCHWCHVMEHESFEDAEVAKILNENFVCIKVDREERPDVDEQYMMATQAFTGRGGWPNSVWLIPDGRPWYAGTYFPKDDHGSQPGFKTVLLSLARIWKNQRAQVADQAKHFEDAIHQMGAMGVGPSDQPLSMRSFTQAATFFRMNYDERNGGFGSAPKFPPYGTLAVLIRAYKQTHDAATLNMITHTLDAMAAGGIYDHLGGGFHRYSTDERWLVPHFEKMLYDNAQQIDAYAAGHELNADPNDARIVAETFAWLQREMTDPAGGFYSAQDADSDGEEGRFFLWTKAQITSVLGEDDAKLFCLAYGIKEKGNFIDPMTGNPTGENIIYLPRSIDQTARDVGIKSEELGKRLQSMRAKLLAVRLHRVHPHTDDKVLASWNGLMIGALAHAGHHFKNPAYTAAAVKAADFILTHLRSQDGRLFRSWCKGKAKLPGYLDDYAYMIRGLLALDEDTGDKRWLETARQLADVMIADFYDDDHGAFFMTSATHDILLMRSKGLLGGDNLPNANGVAVKVLLDLALATGERRYADLAVGTLHALSKLIEYNPQNAASLLVALSEFNNTQDKLPGGKELLAELNPPIASGDADSSSHKAPVTIGVYAASQTVQPGAVLQVAVRLTIDKGWHIYASDSGDKFVQPTSVKLTAPTGFALGGMKWPPTTQLMDPVSKKQLPVYEGQVTVLAPVKVPADATPGEVALTFEVRTQACDDKACLPQTTQALTVKIRVDPTEAISPSPLRHPDVFGPLGIKK